MAGFPAGSLLAFSEAGRAAALAGNTQNVLHCENGPGQSWDPEHWTAVALIQALWKPENQPDELSPPLFRQSFQPRFCVTPEKGKNGTLYPSVIQAHQHLPLGWLSFTQHSRKSCNVRRTRAQVQPVPVLPHLPGNSQFLRSQEENSVCLQENKAKTRAKSREG